METANETPLTPIAFLARSAQVWGEKTAVIEGTTRLTYAEMGRRAQELARAIAGSGVRPGDRVAVLMPNVTEMVIAHFAVPLAGATLVAINTRLSADEVRYILEHSGARLLLLDHRLAKLAAAACTDPDPVECVVTPGGESQDGQTA